MTRSVFAKIVLLVAIVLFAVFVWPTRYRPLDPTEKDGKPVQRRADRVTGRVDVRYGSGPWVEYREPISETDWAKPGRTGEAVNRAKKAQGEIQQMNDAAQKAMDH